MTVLCQQKVYTTYFRVSGSEQLIQEMKKTLKKMLNSFQEPS